MLPMVAKIIEVTKPLDTMINKGLQAEFLCIVDFFPINIVEEFKYAISLVANLEFPKMVVPPIKLDLDNFVQHAQRRRDWDFNSPPDLRPDMSQFNADADCRFTHRSTQFEIQKALERNLHQESIYYRKIFGIPGNLYRDF